MTMLEWIKDIKEDKSYCWKIGKSKKEAYHEIMAELEGLIKARSWINDNNHPDRIFEIVGLPAWYNTGTGQIGLSYRQLRNIVIRYIKTGTLPKKPYNTSNTEDFNF